jgi:hypothetical protein
MHHLEKIKEAILNINFFLVKEANMLVEIITVEYTIPNLYLLSDILRKGDYDKVCSLQSVQNLFGEYIYVYRFSDEAARWYYAMIYDSTGLYQKLTVLEMFRYVKPIHN